MTDISDLNERLAQSLRTLRAWHWMAQISTSQADIIVLLTQEARDLIELGRHFPARAREIGRLIVAYQRLIARLREQDLSDKDEAEGRGRPVKPLRRSDLRLVRETVLA